MNSLPDEIGQNLYEAGKKRREGNKINIKLLKYTIKKYINCIC
jgi:hypothetical protein